MKDSGIEWIGEIPGTWEVVPLFYCVDAVNDKNQQLAIKNVLKFTYGKIIDKATYNEDTPANILETIRSYTIVKKNDIMINGLNLAFDFVTQRVGEVSKTGVITSAYMAIRPNNRIIARYLTYLLKTYDNLKAFHNMGGGVRKILNYKELSKQGALLPPKSEQQQIANFLDRKTTEIDELIDKINDEIEKLQQYQNSVITRTVTKGLDPSVSMKDSGIKWISEIPETWKVIKAKYIFIQRNSKGNKRSLNLLSPTQNYGVIPQTMYEKISGMKPVKIDKQKNLNFFKTIHKGDFCISLRSFEGGFEYSHYEGVVSPAYQVFYCTDNNTIDGYYKYLFKDKTFINKMNSYTMSLRDGKNIAFSDFGNTFITVPPKKEQQKIANFLDQKVSQIQKVIKIKQRQINQLTEYKNSLIFEYVTGKKQVEEAN